MNEDTVFTRDVLRDASGEELEITAVSSGSFSVDLRPTQPHERICRVYWGSHGCDRPRGHEGPHLCLTCWSSDEDGWVGAPPYYGPETNFYGEDITTERRHGDDYGEARGGPVGHRKGETE